MKRRFAFTLIEMMIVIALLEIVCISCFTPAQSLFEEVLHYDDELKNQEMLSDAFVVLKKAFADSENIKLESSNEVTFIGGSCDSIHRENGGRTLVVYKGNAVFRLKHGEDMVCGPFAIVDDKTLKYTMKSILKDDKTAFTMYWRCGR